MQRGVARASRGFNINEQPQRPLIGKETSLML